MAAAGQSPREGLGSAGAGPRAGRATASNENDAWARAHGQGPADDRGHAGPGRSRRGSPSRIGPGSMRLGGGVVGRGLGAATSSRWAPNTTAGSTAMAPEQDHDQHRGRHEHEDAAALPPGPARPSRSEATAVLPRQAVGERVDDLAVAGADGEAVAEPADEWQR